MTPKEFQKSNLAIELKVGKKRLEDALHGVSDEQCERAGATRSGSVLDLLSEIVAKEVLALMEVSDRLPGLPMNHLANADGPKWTASGAEKAPQISPSKTFWLNSASCARRSFVAWKAASRRVRNLTRNIPTSLMRA